MDALENALIYFSDAPDLFFELVKGQFVIFFRECSCSHDYSVGEIKKLVLKIK